jgi:isoleucyl-tRNA synthetase
MSDWMISKKRYWGLALPIFPCVQCGTFDVIGSREELRERAVDGWDKFDGHTPHRPWVDEVKIACSQCGKALTRIKDVGNPWLDAGIVGFSTLRWREDPEYWKRWFPADLVTESFPGQFRNWFYSLLAMSTVLAGQAPFRKLFGYALMKAEDGREMHKSWGNAIEFVEAAEKAGVDAMRWVFASHVPDQNLLFGYDTITEARRKFLTLWNVYSFYVTYANVDDFDPRTAPVPMADRNLLDRWIIGSLHQLIGQARESFSEYKVHTFMRRFERFVDDLSTWYVRRSRRRFWKSETGRDKLAAYQTLHEVLVTVAELLAPIAPFVTEEMYQNLVRSWDEGAPISVHHRTYPVAKPELTDEALNRAMNAVLAIVELGRQTRQRAGIKVRQPLAQLIVRLPDAATRATIRPLEDQITEELNVKTVEFRDDLSDLVRHTVKLDPKKAGPRLGASMQKVLEAVKNLTPAALLGYNAGAPLDVEVGGQRYTLLAEELVVEPVAVRGWAVGASDALMVVISTEVTKELKQEGLVREVIRLVQDLRKTRGLNVSDRIALHLDASPFLRTAVESNLDILKQETLAVRVSFDMPAAAPSEAKVETETLRFDLEPATM